MTSIPDRPGTALLVIDMQQGVVAEAHNREAVIANIGRLVERRRPHHGRHAQVGRPDRT